MAEDTQPTVSEYELTSDRELPDYDDMDAYYERVDHPEHYKTRELEAIDIIEMIIEVEEDPKVAYAMSNVIKYLLRFRDKGRPVEDLKKAEWYLKRMIGHVIREG